MKITLEPTGTVVKLNGVDARIWEGKTDRGIRVTCFVTRVAVYADEPESEIEYFNRELKETDIPRASEAWPLRMIL